MTDDSGKPSQENAFFRYAKYGSVAFEFLGFSDCPINTPAIAAETVDGIDAIDLVLDSCHWHASGSEPLDSYPVERIALVMNEAFRIGTVKNSKNFFRVDVPARSMRTGAWKDWGATTASSEAAPPQEVVR